MDGTDQNTHLLHLPLRSAHVLVPKVQIGEDDNPPPVQVVGEASPPADQTLGGSQEPAT